MVDAFHAGLFLEKKRTNSGLFMESTSKHSIYTFATYNSAAYQAALKVLGSAVEWDFRIVEGAA